MKTLLMIGGGLQQVRAVEKAKDLGHSIIVTDRDPHCPCSKYADDFYKVNGRDIESLVSLGLYLKRQDRLDGVFTFTELVTSVAAVASTCELIGSGLSSAVNCQDKGLTKKIWTEKGIKTPKGHLYYGQIDVHEILSTLRFPLIVKPVTGSGGSGMVFIQGERDFSNWYKTNCTSISYTSRVVIEEVALGTSHDVNGIFDIDGGFYPYGIVDRDFWPDTLAENTINAPTSLSLEHQKELYTLLEKSAKALGVKKGPVKGDAILTKDGFLMLEIAPRLHGPKFSLYAMPAITNNYLKGFFEILTGGKWLGSYEPRSNGFVFKSQLITVPPGKITSIDGVNDILANNKKDLEVMIFKKVGDLMREYKSSHDTFGYLMARGINTLELEMRLAEATSGITVEVDKSPPSSGAVS